jgi:hypothetical protein
MSLKLVTSSVQAGLGYQRLNIFSAAYEKVKHRRFVKSVEAGKTLAIYLCHEASCRAAMAGLKWPMWTVITVQTLMWPADSAKIYKI